MKKVLLCVSLALAFALGCKAERKARIGDTVVIDFRGYMDGVQFEGGTAEFYPLKLGSSQFVPGFEEQLVGAAAGEERDVRVTFPENYYPALAGKPVLFKVKVVSIE